MNRILPIQGTVTARGDTQMAEANRSQQQRFDQAMRLEPEQKAPDKYRANGQSKTLEPRPQQLLQTQQQKKLAADSVRQSDIAASHSQPKHLQTQQLITRKASGLSTVPEVTERDQKEIESKRSQQMRDAQDNVHEGGTRDVALPAQENACSVPSSMLNTPVPRPLLEGAGDWAPESALSPIPSLMKEPLHHPEQRESDSRQHDLQTIGIAAGMALPQSSDQAPLQQGEASLAQVFEFAERKISNSDTDINALTLSDEIPEASGQPIPPQVKTPGDLQLARLAPAENNRELGQLLERLAVDIYQELGRPERPPLLRLTLPQLGDLSIRIAHHHGELQIEILATAQGELLLNQGRSDLVDRLQRLYPGERVALDLFGQPDSEQGSRHKRSIYEEWDADA
ncbi:type III secretion system needle length determinant [Aeromonas veronii]|uniref:type III secretion system needle length determinant n=1 Tax=Aeromonas veronii TaxID=654 RepID=UPI001F1FA07D|nr:type III secretion system needle length determinant [Aeromonas veronii]